MKLSFIIPAYNEEAIIGKCLESILKELENKNYDTEIIVVDNNCTDRTREVALSYSGVTVVPEEQKGVVFARQKGFHVATGDLLCNIDADTMLTPGWIETVIKEFERNKNLVALSGPYIYYDLPLSTRVAVKVFYFFGYVAHLVSQYVLHSGAMLQGGNFVVRKTALEKLGGYDTSFQFYGEDTDTACRMSKVGIVKWTFRLPLYTSGRRLKGEGVIHMGLKYGINFIWVSFFRKPFSKTYKDIRDEK